MVFIPETMVDLQAMRDCAPMVLFLSLAILCRAK